MVVGGGDTAMEEAMYLSGICSSVTLVHRRERVPREQDDAGSRLQEPEDQARSTTPAIDEVLDVSKGEVTGARVRNLKTKKTMVVPVTGFFIAIGHTPNTELFTGPARAARQRLHPDEARIDADERAGGLRGGRRAGLRVPAGRHRRGDGVHGGARGGAVARAERSALSGQELP